MKIWLRILCFLCLATSSVLASGKGDSTIEEVKARSASYVDAFNRGKLSACVAHWTADAEFSVPLSGFHLQGKREIQKALEPLVNQDKRANLKLSRQRFRQISADVVIEEGFAELTAPGQPSERASYQVVHVKQEGDWYRSSARETSIPVARSGESKLGELDWLIGDFVEKHDGGSLHLHGEWIDSKKFLLRTFKVVSGDDVTLLSGRQTIGWDNATQQIRSWTFDSQGGIEEATWHRDGKRWHVKVKASLPDGSTGTEQRLLTLINDDKYQLEIIEQQINGRLLPTRAPVTLRRRSN